MQKDITISKLRCVSTSMIVLLHIFQYLGNTYRYLYYFSDWLNLGLVMFFVMSAFLYSNRVIKKNNILRWFTHRYTELIIPCLLVTVATLIIYSVFIGGLSKEIIYNSLLSSLGLEAFVSDGWMFVQLWFLTYILFCYFTVPFIQKINIRNISETLFWVIIVGITLILQGLSSTVSLMTGLPILSWGVLLRFYLPYFIFKRYSIKSKKCASVMLVLSTVSLLLIVVTIFVRYWIPVGIMGAIAELFFIYTQTLAGIALFYWLYLLLERVKFNERFLVISDKYSYAIYLTHCLFIGYSTSLIGYFSNIYLGIIVALVFTCISSILVEKNKKIIIYLCSKIFEKQRI